LSQEANKEERDFLLKEIKNLIEQKEQLIDKIKEQIITEEGTEQNIFIEIRPGTGGTEAGLFARDLYQMYEGFAKERGENVFNWLKNEAGVHRVQRVPRTESKGRIHTSTASVVILPEVQDVVLNIRSQDLKIETYSSGGPGGQHANKTASAVRVFHIPTKITATSQDGRDQRINLKRAMSVLKARILEKLQVEKAKELLTDEQLQKKFAYYRQKIRRTPQKDREKALDKYLVPVFALVREIIKRKIGLLLFPTQIFGGIVLHYGNIAQMNTGEGKTLTAFLPICLNALLGRTKKRLYNDCTVIYTTGSELGFDYLRNNLVTNIEAKKKQDYYYAIADEIDSLFIDECTNPLIISQRVQGENVINPAEYQLATKLANSLVEKKDYKAKHFYHKGIEYIVDREEEKLVLIDALTGRLVPNRVYGSGIHQAIESKENLPVSIKSKTIATITYQNFFRLFDKLSGMTGTAASEAEEFRQVYGMEVIAILPYRKLIRKDYNDLIFWDKKSKYDYIIKLIKKNQKTFRQPILIGSPSVEVSEHLSSLLKKENIPHNLLNAVNHKQEAEIIAKAGQIGTITISTNMAGRGTDIILDLEFLLFNLKFVADKLDNANTNEAKQVKEKINEFLKWCSEHKEDAKKIRKKINEFLRELRGKKYTKKVREIIDKFMKGLGVLGIERNTTRRADNQLRGRAGRQGDPGESQFFVSLEDEMLKNFGVKEQVGKLFNQKQLKELFHRPLSGKVFNYLISEPQETLRNSHASNRQYHLNYDLLINRQRQFIYNYRDKLLSAPDLTKIVKKRGQKKPGKMVPIEQEYLKARLTLQAIEKDTGKDSVFFLCKLTEGLDMGGLIANTLVFVFPKSEKEKINNLSGLLKINDLFSETRKPYFALTQENSPDLNILIYNFGEVLLFLETPKTKKFALRSIIFNTKKTEKIVEVEIDPIDWELANSDTKKSPLKKIIFKGEEAKLEIINLILDYNFKKSNKEFTVKADYFAPIKTYEELELNFDTSDNIILKGKEEPQTSDPLLTEKNAAIADIDNALNQNPTINNNELETANQN
ncbi:7191_t:CDS:2, partial [Cetraspora pellucida]